MVIASVQIGAAFARTAVGLSWEASAAAVRAGITRLVAHDYMVDKDGQPFVVAAVPSITGVTRLDRVMELFDQILDDLLPTLENLRGELMVWVCLPDAYSMHRALFTSRLVARAKCEPASVVVVARGGASGVFAIRDAVQKIHSRALDAALIIGVDSHLDPDILETLDQAGHLSSESNKFGFPPGEGAGALLLASAPVLRSARLSALGGVIDVGCALEPEPMGSAGVSTGVGLAKALRDATVQFSTEVTVGRIYSDQNGQRYRDSDYVWATQRVRPVFADFSDFVTPAEAWGDVGAATATLLVGLPLAAAHRGYATKPTSLVYCCSTGKERGAVTLQHRGVS